MAKKEKTFAQYKTKGHLWITLSTGEYYPDILPFACELYKPVLVLFGQLLESAHSSTDLFMAISATPTPWMRVQLCRVFRKYVSPETPVEMLKKKSAATHICQQFGRGFRAITDVQQRFLGRLLPDEAMWNDYAALEALWQGGRVRVVTLRMVPERITREWLHS